MDVAPEWEWVRPGPEEQDHPGADDALVLQVRGAPAFLLVPLVPGDGRAARWEAYAVLTEELDEIDGLEFLGAFTSADEARAEIDASRDVVLSSLRRP